MRWLVGIVAAVVLTGGTFIASGGATARAAPGVAAYRVPHEVSKFTLGETSYDGPALWTQRGPSAPAGPLAVLAWTGTDSRLNFVFTNDGVSYFGKKTLNETSFVRPAVVRGQGVGGSVAPVVLAWTGTDAGHRLNVLYDVPGAAPMKLTLWSDNSFTSPAIEWLGGNTNTLLLAWAGTDAGHALNILPINVTDQGLVTGTKITQWNFHSFGQPALIHDYTILPKDTRFFLSWSDMASRRIAWATSPDGKMWTQQPTFYETSGSAPSMIGLNETLAHMPPYWLGWTGTDAAHHVNVLYALDINQWTTNFVKATLPETAVGGTVIGFFLAAPPHDDQMLVAWTGTDAAHHLNVAWVGV
jgi:hypothetical protein